jgi:hypothetical protein
VDHGRQTAVVSRWEPLPGRAARGACGRDTPRPVRDPRAPRGRGDGGGLPRPRSPPRARGGGQADHDGGCAIGGPPAPLRDRGPRRRPARPPQRRHRPRRRLPRGTPLPRPRVARGRDAAGDAPAARGPAASAGRHLGARDLPRSRRRPRPRHRPPRPQARERLSNRRRPRQAPGLRSRQAARAARHARGAGAPDHDVGHLAWGPAGDGRLHGPGAGEGGDAGPAHRRLRPGSGSLRDGGGAARLRGGDASRGPRRDPARRAARARLAPAGGSGSPRVGGPAVPRQAPGRPLLLGTRGRGGARDRARLARAGTGPNGPGGRAARPVPGPLLLHGGRRRAVLRPRGRGGGRSFRT